jgi:hypothetical protein
VSGSKAVENTGDVGAFRSRMPARVPAPESQPNEGKESAMRDGIQKTLTSSVHTAILLDVSQSEDFAVRLHVDLRRQASAICAAGR